MCGEISVSMRRGQPSAAGLLAEVPVVRDFRLGCSEILLKERIVVFDLCEVKSAKEQIAEYRLEWTERCRD